MSIFHLHDPKNLFLWSAHDWIVIAKQHCVCAIVEPWGEHLEQGLNLPQWMKVVKVSPLKTETSSSTRMAIAGPKQAIDLNISAVPPSEAPDSFLMHLRDSPAGPTELLRNHIQGTIIKAASGPAWIPRQVSDDELQTCVSSEGEPSQSAIWQCTPLLYSLMR